MRWRVAATSRVCDVATTSPELARALVDLIQRAGLPYAVLHQEDELASGIVTSDIDMIAGVEISRFVRDLALVSPPAGLFLVMLWPYDVGCATSLWMDQLGQQSVQLDLSCDPAGRSTYGLRTDLALQRCVRGSRWTRLDPIHEWAYLASKRAYKGDAQARDALLQRGKHLGVGRRDLETVLSRAAARRARSFLVGGVQHRPRAWARATPWNLGRLARRLLSPIGHVVGFSEDLSSEQLFRLASAYERMLPRVRVATASPSEAVRCEWDRRHPCLTLLSARSPTTRPDVWISGELLQPQIREAMTETVMARMGAR